ncbi:hypothetical protein GQ55_2G451400 [Panicum hallii var. hallii]|uniref:Uncharacterized protein n=1 Tax=Panicum hallii var. hallii TaxID=1504633 RepID=A0A2T7EZ89_9POAL|nr:hypothetical protein GQ55_2G451400 [Panicum hallii var. hallii]
MNETSTQPSKFKVSTFQSNPATVQSKLKFTQPAIVLYFHRKDHSRVQSLNHI